MRRTGIVIAAAAPVRVIRAIVDAARVAGWTVDSMVPAHAAWVAGARAQWSELGRESAQLAILGDEATELVRIERGAIVRAYDPAVTTSPLEGVEIAKDAYSACEGASVAMVLTEWDEFKWLDLDKLASCMAHRTVVDARNILDRGALNRRGFAYSGIGRR